ncbi:MAG: HD domain-containing phosphohydrolase [Candidatus Sumerlaeia bacterium]
MVISLYDQTILGRILVIDDEPIVLHTLTEILREVGHEVVSVPDGKSALAAVENQRFDLVLTDMFLPGISGLDILVRVKGMYPTLPVILVTGQPNLDQAVTAMKKGAADFITKPFSIDYIHHVVQKNLQEQRLVSENQRLLAELNNKAVIEKLNRQLHQKISQLTKLYNISESFHAFVDNHSLLQYVVDLASDLTGAQRVSLLTFDRRHQFLIMRASKGISDEVARKACVHIGQGIAGKVAEQFKPVRITSSEYSEYSKKFEPEVRRSYATNSWLSVPMFIGGELFGVLNLTDKKDMADFTEEDEYLALMLAEKAGIKIENNVLYEGIYANLLDTLKALVSTIEAKDSYTRSHSQRVTETAIILARHIGCSEEDCESISFAGILHDIGKIGIQDNILQKKGRLDDREYGVIKTHPVIGETIIEPLGLIEAERDIIRHHHERIDGKGYPDRLGGKEIPILSRIVSIADSFDAMTSTRSYRAAQDMQFVLTELSKNAGAQFDAELVDAMLDLIDQDKIKPGKEKEKELRKEAEAAGKPEEAPGISVETAKQKIES